MVQYTWDEWTNKYISAEWQIMWWGTAYKTAEWKWSLTKPTEQKTTTTTVKQASNWMNSVSQASLDVNKNNAKAWTWYVAPMPEQDRLYKQDEVAKNVAQKWSWLDYDTQQKKLQTVAWLKDYLDSKWIVSKTQPTTTTQTTTPTKATTTKQTTPQQQQWDYQDNSQARKDQILDHLNNYRVTNPELFEDASMFYNFFIDWNGRSQEQIDLLWDYFNRVQKYGKYDNLPASSIWDMLVNGKLPEDYLNYLKSTDPQKYQEALSYKQDAEDTIKYESYLSDIADQAWVWWFEKFYKWIFGYKDENQDNIDDSLYIAPTQEEQTKQNRVNTIDSRIMEIKNMQKNLLDDLTEQYPWVPKATLMWIVQDRTKDLQREYDDLMVERTWLVWNIEYMQNERDMQSKARQETFNNTFKALWAYYDYSPEWIAELTQSKYAAENITLDQAEEWTDTQKQMALEQVLTPLYEKYWSIIQRSQAQVINDVMAYAKKNWVTLSEAFEKNFMSQLRNKPQFETLSTWWSLTATSNKRDKITFTWADWKEVTALYNQANWDIKNLDWTPYTWKITTQSVWWATFTPVSQTAKIDALNSVQSEYWVGSTYKNWRCWELANLYLQKAGSDIRLWDDVSTKTKWITTKVNEWLPQEWDLVVRDFSNNPKASKVAQDNWHVAVVTKVYDDWTFDVYQQNWHWNHTVSEDHITSKDYIAWYINPAQVKTSWDYTTSDYMDYETWVLNFIPIQLRNTEKEADRIITKVKSYYDRWLNMYDAALIQMWFNVQSATQEWKKVAEDVVNMLSYVGDENAFDETFMTMLARNVNAWQYTDAIKKAENKVYEYIMKTWENAISKTDMKDVAVAISSLNKYKNNWNWLQNTELAFENIIWAEWKKTWEFDVWQANLINALEWLWYSEDNAKQMVPDLKNTRSTFVWRMERIQDLLLQRYNAQRTEYWMQPVTLAVLLWNQSILTAYWVNAEWEALELFSD